MHLHGLHLKLPGILYHASERLQQAREASIALSNIGFAELTLEIPLTFKRVFLRVPQNDSLSPVIPLEISVL